MRENMPQTLANKAPAPAAQLIDGNGRKQKDAIRYRLVVAIDTDQRHSVREHADDQHADEGSRYAAFATIEARAAEQDGGHYQELVADAARRHGSARLSDQKYSRQAGRDPAGDKNPEAIAAEIQSTD